MRDKSNIKTIKELHEYTFYIPDYQRNYRWTKDEVQQLIDDIYYSEEGYSLQPIVVKKKKDKEYELIDGQQRLTTLYIIFMIFEIEYNKDVEYYKIKRDNYCNCLSKKIDEIRKLSTNEIDKLEDIDEWHIAHAYNTIKKYIEKLKNKKFLEPCKNTQVIWYEIDENEDPIIVFERLNVGKIPLEKAEIIKAEAITELKEEQDRGACAKLWYETEIDLRKKDDEKYSVLATYKAVELKDGTQRISAYLDMIANNKSKIYDSLKKYVNIFNDLLKNVKLFNLIGYYIECSKDNKFKFIKSKEDDKKIEEKIKSKIMEKIENDIDSYLNEENDKYIINLNYTDNGKDIKNILLLYNIALYLEENEKFPFNRFKKDKYTIEHINAQKLKYEEVFMENGNFNKDEFIRQINDIIKNLNYNHDFELDEIEQEELENIDIDKINDDADNSISYITQNISNLTLLSHELNDKLNNKSYQGKYNLIENKNELLLGTKKIFDREEKKISVLWDGSEYLGDIIYKLKNIKKLLEIKNAEKTKQPKQRRKIKRK